MPGKLVLRGGRHSAAGRIPVQVVQAVLVLQIMAVRPEVGLAQVPSSDLRVRWIGPAQVARLPLERSANGMGGADTMGELDELLRCHGTLICSIYARQLLTGLEQGSGEDLLGVLQLLLELIDLLVLQLHLRT